MSKAGKRIRAAREGVDRNAVHSVEDAVKALKANASAKFDETIEVSMNLGVDPRHADQMVRGVVQLPNGTGKSVRVAVFAKGDKAEEATAAGADLVGADVVITGHNHEPSTELKDMPSNLSGKQLLLNPGECCGWVNDRCTCAVLDLDTLRADIVDIRGLPGG